MDLDQIKILIAEGEAQITKGDWDSASKTLAKAKTTLDGVKLDPDVKEALVQVLKLRSYAEARRGQYRIAVQSAERAVELSVSMGDIEGESDGLRRIGYIHWLKGDLEKARVFFDDALIKARECGANGLVGRIKVELGNVSAALFQFDEAKAQYLEATRILKAENDIPELARVYNNLGYNYLLQKKYEEAVSALKISMDLADKVSDARLKAMAAINSAECFVCLGNADVAHEMMEQVTRTMVELDDKVGIASAYRINGMIHTAKREWPKAETYFRKALALMNVSGVPEMEGLIYKEHGRMFMQKGDMERARVKLSQALEIYKKLGVDMKAAEVKQLLMQTQR